MAALVAVFHQVRGLVHGRGKKVLFVDVNAEKQGEVGDLDQGAVDPCKLPHGHDESQWQTCPSKDIAGGNVREEGVILDHRDGLYGEQEPKVVSSLACVEQRMGSYLCSWCAFDEIDL